MNLPPGLPGVSAVSISTAYLTSDHRNVSVLNSVYFTTETLITVGFGDFAFEPESAWLRVWAIVLMELDASLVATTYHTYAA